jgi:hypothetical protein
MSEFAVQQASAASRCTATSHPSCRWSGHCAGGTAPVRQPNRLGSVSGGSGERDGQAVPGPQFVLDHEAGEERVELGRHRGALGGPVCDEVVGSSVVRKGRGCAGRCTRGRVISDRSTLGASLLVFLEIVSIGDHREIAAGECRQCDGSMSG